MTAGLQQIYFQAFSFRCSVKAVMQCKSTKMHPLPLHGTSHSVFYHSIKSKTIHKKFKARSLSHRLLKTNPLKVSQISLIVDTTHSCPALTINVTQILAISTIPEVPT